MVALTNYYNDNLPAETLNFQEFMAVEIIQSHKLMLYLSDMTYTTRKDEAFQDSHQARKFKI
jgi:hypothetical protein